MRSRNASAGRSGRAARQRTETGSTVDVVQTGPQGNSRSLSGERVRNGDGTGSTVTGTATGFCQIVTQTRNVADTDIQACGAHATRWMEIAQCFAGGPETPPAPGTRFKADAA